MTDADRQRAVLKLLDASTLSSADLDARYRQAIDADYWRKLNPTLSVEGDYAHPTESDPITAEQITAHVGDLRREGYFRTRAVVDPCMVNRMRDGIEKLRAERWPAIFSYVYDEFWRIVRTPSLVRLAAEFLGEGYKQNSYLWTYYVAPVKGASGWPPHADSPYGGDSRLTVWVPLAEATLENGCMYVIPRDRVPESLPPNFEDVTTINAKELGALLHSVKALPAKAGSLLGWNHQLIHWGSYSSGHTTPRISMMVEFIAGNSEPDQGELPLWDAVELPPFAERTRMIGKSLVRDRRYEPVLARYGELGERLKRSRAGDATL